MQLPSNLEANLLPLVAAGERSEQSAAVAVLLVRQRLEVLIVERSRREGDPWSGQMAFPGGHYRSTDGNLLETAVRETREEVAIDLQGRMTGRLPVVEPRNRPGLRVAPFLAVLDNRLPVLLSRRELENYFWPNADDLRNTYDVRLIPQIKREMESYLCNDRIVWGMTARILGDLFKLLS